ncbi:hypothetical protein [Parvibaculum sp.]|uniref:hypothetical protein n=1 Tax=Parvibaculum sp. TaxID=2024848 RepID=UPI003FA78029
MLRYRGSLMMTSSVWSPSVSSKPSEAPWPVPSRASGGAREAVWNDCEAELSAVGWRRVREA